MYIVEKSFAAVCTVHRLQNNTVGHTLYKKNARFVEISIVKHKYFNANAYDNAFELT